MAAKNATASATTTGRLAGKIALVTGAAGNLGTEIVRHYLRQGATVVMSGRTMQRLQAALDAAQLSFQRVASLSLFNYLR